MDIAVAITIYRCHDDYLDFDHCYTNAFDNCYTMTLTIAILMPLTLTVFMTRLQPLCTVSLILITLLSAYRCFLSLPHIKHHHHRYPTYDSDSDYDEDDSTVATTPLI